MLVKDRTEVGYWAHVAPPIVAITWKGTPGPSHTHKGLATRRRSSGEMPEAWVYLLRCRDDSLYTGWTVDLEHRLARHRAGTASRYTASRLPIEIELAIPMPDRTAARREEARIKRLPRAAKLALLR
jgi:putative endonuclease